MSMAEPQLSLEIIFWITEEWTNMRRSASAICLGLLSCLMLSQAQAQEVSKKFIESGATARVGGYRPVRAEMDASNVIAKKSPEGLVDPKFGKMVFGEAEFGFILDTDEDGAQTLYVDSNADGDFTNDPEAAWNPQKRGELTMYSGSTKVELSPEQMGAVNFYRFDPEDPRRAQLANTVLYYSDFGYQFTMKLDDQELSTFVSGDLAGAQTLPIDRDGNGKISRSFEVATIGKPFNFTGTPYVLSVEDGDLVVAKADVELEQMPLPPNLELGQPALKFTAETMDGKQISFPGDYKGKIVMLDFWATWCGPCIAELPNVKAAYDEYHEEGFEILGISFDQPDQDEKVKEFLEKRELPWPQVYEGKGWDTTIGDMHDVSAIPFVLLVDGDSGKIIGTTRQLRGEGLPEFIGSKLKEKEREGGE